LIKRKALILVGGDAAGEIYGDVTNIAARVQALAEPGAVLITARVQRQVAGVGLRPSSVARRKRRC
jgi:class 3 adenylate cyclase